MRKCTYYLIDIISYNIKRDYLQGSGDNRIVSSSCHSNRKVQNTIGFFLFIQNIFNPTQFTDKKFTKVDLINNFALFN